MSVTSASAAMAQEGSFQQPPPEAPGEQSSASGSGLTQVVPFSSGNPRIEETRGIMHLYPDDTSPSTALPVGRKPLVCVLEVPNHMTYADFCQFCGSFIQHVLEMRIVRNDGVEDRYSVLIGFDSQVSADEFYRHFNGKRFSSLEMLATSFIRLMCSTQDPLNMHRARLSLRNSLLVRSALRD